jgi:hypothetical protein
LVRVHSALIPSAPKTDALTRLPLSEADFGGGIPHQISLGPIGRPGSEKLNKELESYIPLMVNMLESGKVRPNQYDLVGKTGFESVLEAWEYQKSGKGGSNKVIVKLQEE